MGKRRREGWWKGGRRKGRGKREGKGWGGGGEGDRRERGRGWEEEWRERGKDGESVLFGFKLYFGEYTCKHPLLPHGLAV